MERDRAAETLQRLLHSSPMQGCFDKCNVVGGASSRHLPTLSEEQGDPRVSPHTCSGTPGSPPEFTPSRPLNAASEQSGCGVYRESGLQKAPSLACAASAHSTSPFQRQCGRPHPAYCNFQRSNASSLDSDFDPEPMGSGLLGVLLSYNGFPSLGPIGSMHRPTGYSA